MNSDYDFTAGVVVGSICALLIYVWGIHDLSGTKYKQGQIEALSGIIKVHQVTNNIGRVKWEYIK
jgi:hypothetical protein